MLDTLLVLSGLLIILIALVQAKKLYSMLKDRASQKVWKFMIALISFFALGYIAILCLDMTDHRSEISKLTSFIFFFGAIFVFLTTLVFSKLNAELRSYADNLEVTLVTSSKFATLGEMAGSIAHEINNPLAIIKGTATQISSCLKKTPIDTALVSEKASKIEKTVDRIAKIVYGLRTYSRDGSSDPFMPVPIFELIKDTVSLCEEKFKLASTQLEVKPIDAYLVCEGRAIELSQVLLNLLNNACDAVGELNEKWVRISALDGGNSVIIRVEDSGSGILKEHIEKLFQPFYTTKEIGKGTGLGLSISLGIIKSHNGTIKVDSAAANTCFVVELPKKQS